MTAPLSEAEHAALDLLRENGGCILTSRVEDKTTTGVFGEKIPGHAIFRKLEKKGLVYYTEEEPVTWDDGMQFTFTNEIYLVKP